MFYLFPPNEKKKKKKKKQDKDIIHQMNQILLFQAWTLLALILK